ncbi:tetratricopeptide repeat protein [Streptomyces chumphonensis]|uniref:Tetratricopeptide repeat protein n=1 Tax=Streptomyces chumphonensis TaxID=1214925 RepID=A0A927F0T5_9ACTN|nr:tetratricopeptide repeat protein [Streptomyces chumphonensis]
MLYVQRAQHSADPQFYAKAEQALRRSLGLRQKDNHLAMMGNGALAAARHEFSDAAAWARKALAAHPGHTASYGVLADALLQLGRYDEAFQATQDMVDRQPATPSLARASYAWELRGDTSRASALMRRALRSASTPADAVFARLHLALLALNDGRPKEALKGIEQGLRVEPDHPTLLGARARAHRALGDPDAAVADYRAAIDRVPHPSLLLEMGELLQAQGRTEQAREHYDLFRTTSGLFRQEGVAADAEEVLFEADHGQPARAVRLGREAAADRPFLATLDAYAWSLHKVGQHGQALPWANAALELGTRSALFHYHRGMIHHALGHRASARTDLERALDIDPHFHPLHAPRARTALDEIGPAQ